MKTCTRKEYLQSKSTIEARIEAVENLIDIMTLNMLDVVENDGTASYSMDDGQMKVTTEYRSVKQVEAGIMALEKMLHRYINRANGHVTVLRGRLNY